MAALSLIPEEWTYPLALYRVALVPLADDDRTRALIRLGALAREHGGEVAHEYDTVIFLVIHDRLAEQLRAYREVADVRRMD